MDCAKFNKTLAKLHTLHKQLDTAIQNAAESGTNKQSVINIKDELSHSSDEALEAYLSEFGANFPGLFGWKLDKPIYGFNNDIETITLLSDTECLLTGSGWRGDSLGILTKDETGNWKVGQKIIDGSGFFTSITAAAPLSSNECLVGGIGGLRIFSKDQNNKWAISKKIKNSTIIKTIIPLPDNKFIVQEDSNAGALKILTKDPNNDWELNYRIRLLHNNIDTIVPLSSTEYIISDEHGHSQILVDNRDGTWSLNNTIDGQIFNAIITPISDKEFLIIERRSTFDTHSKRYIRTSKFKFYIKQQDGRWMGNNKVINLKSGIEAIMSLSNTEFLVGGDNGELRILTKDQHHQWYLDRQIGDFKNTINAIAPLPDGQFAIGGGNGELKTLKSIAPTTHNLKRIILNNQI